MKISDNARNAAVNAVAGLINGGGSAGKIFIRTGAAPTNTTDADSGTLLSTLPMTNPAFGSAAGGTATANAITSDTNIAATGTAGHFRCKDSMNVTVLQGSVGTSGADINFDSVSFIAGGTCAITSLTLTQPAS
jgi:hypothetical protein